MDKSIPAPFSRVGGKTRLKTRILPLFPKEFKTYVEPFVGGGAIVMGHKFTEGQKIVLNDKDSKLMAAWRALKAAHNPQAYAKYNTTSLPTLQRLADSGPPLVKAIVVSKNTFMSMGDAGGAKPKLYSNINPWNVLRRVDEYSAKLRGATLSSGDYGAVLARHNNPNTFVYLDPPYEKSDDQGVYKHGDFDYGRLAARLRAFKGKWLLSINDSANIRRLFKGYKARRFTVSSNSPAFTSSRHELLISNY